MSAVPSIYSSDDAYADFYAPRTAQFVAEGAQAQMRPAPKDTTKRALVLIDVQYDFVHPNGNLAVPGAQDDLARTVDFIYRNAEEISSIYVSLDTHREYQVFFNPWWQYEDTGEHPSAFTAIGLSPKGEAIDLSSGRRVRPLIAPKWTLGTYLPTLRDKAKKNLMIWPFHTMEGTPGHCLMPALSEALSFYASARLSQINFITKGTSPFTEHYGIWGAEVEYPGDPSTGINAPMLDVLAQHDEIYVAGQAKKHCVFETVAQQLFYFKNEPDVIRKMHFLDDCTSPVAGMPQAFEDATDAEMDRWAKLGVQFMLSTDSL